MISLIKKLIKITFLKFGFKIVHTYKHDFDANESLLKIIEIAHLYKKKLTVIDVGANVGQSVDRFLKLFSKVEIWSFEPYIKNYEILKEKETKIASLKCFNLGLGDKKKKIPFYLQQDSGSCSAYKLNLKDKNLKLRKKKNYLKDKNTFSIKQNIKINTKTNINIDTLDNVCKINNINFIHILKIDTQGYELKVLKGSKNILAKTLIIEAEIIFSDIYTKKTTLGEIENYLKQFGFVLWEIPYINKFITNKFNRINFIDSHFVNLKLLNKLSNTNL